jgi:tetratricopeptide (TPR) repeat protein
LYTIGVSYGIRANYNFLVRKAWIDALTDTATARKMHTRAIEIDPSFIDARLVLGIHEYVAGSLTWALRIIGSVAGVPSDRNEAIGTLQLVAEKGRINRYDAEVLLCAIYRREKRPREAIPLLNDLLGRFPRGYLVRLELAEAYADLGDRPHALAAVDEAEAMKRANAPGYARLPEAKIRYTRGDVLFTFRQLDGALEEMKFATANSAELDPVTAANSWLRLGQIRDSLGQRAQAIAAYQQVLRIGPDSDAAGDAKSYLSSRYKRP